MVDSKLLSIKLFVYRGYLVSNILHTDKIALIL